MKHLIFIAIIACQQKPITQVVFSPHQDALEDSQKIVDAVNNALGCDGLIIGDGGIEIALIMVPLTEGKSGRYFPPIGPIMYVKADASRRPLILMHEMGHSLGLNHTDERSLMSSSVPLDMDLESGAASLVELLNKHNIKVCE